MKEGKTFLKSRMKWVGLVGLVLSSFSLFVHFLLARFTEYGFSEYQSSTTIFSWRPIFETSDLSRTSPLYRRLWGPVGQLESLHPDANPRGYYAGPSAQTNGYVFVRIQGGFHEIRSSVRMLQSNFLLADTILYVMWLWFSRFLNATLVVPEIQQTTSKKGISSQLKSFAYLYDEEQFMAALAKDVNIVKTLPKNLKSARRNKEIPVFRVPYSSSPYYYLHNVLPILIKHSVVELVVSDGGCLQAILPPHLEEYQRLRCRVAFHALMFWQDVLELATNILRRLRAPGRPFIAFDPGMTRDALAYHGCSELFQDVHAELIQHRRSWMRKRGIIKGQLSVNSAKQRLKGSCPLTPEEVVILLRAYGYPWGTILYVSRGEVFGGQRTLIPLHGMFENVVDRTSLSTVWELSRIYGREAHLDENDPRAPSSAQVEMNLDAWKNSGPGPGPLPPPPARPKTYNLEGWWGWVAESDNEPESTVLELRTNAHKLLWEAIDYMISVEADVFIPGFDRDGKGHPNFASLVMGHRLYQSAASKTYRPDRKEVVSLLEEIRSHIYHANHSWLTSIRKHLRSSLIDGLIKASNKSKLSSFLSHPVPECSCWRPDSRETSSNASSPSNLQIHAAIGVIHHCPAWMDGEKSSGSKEKENEEDIDENDPSSSGLFFQNTGSLDVGGADINLKEESQFEDQEEDGDD